MKKVIQLRGTNATGKTTAVRQFIGHGSFSILEIKVGGNDVEYCYDKERNIVVLGRYDDRECGGIDGRIKSVGALNDSIVKVLREVGPEHLIFEGVVYGLTFKFAYELNFVCDKLGYHYTGLCLTPPLDDALMRLYQRNGGKEINVEHLQNRYFSSIRAYNKLKANGVDVKMINTSAIPKKDMYRIIEDEL